VVACPWYLNLLEWPIQAVRTSRKQHLENSLKQHKHLYPSLMSLKVSVQKLRSSNVVVPYRLLNIHHHKHKQVISKELFSITIWLSSHVYVPFQDYVAQIIKSFLLQWCLRTLNSLRSTFTSTIIPFNICYICHNLIVILNLKKIANNPIPTYCGIGLHSF
jgi:hypothetical protein